ncbi:P-loop containing nucleoside triphosphate hydrolase protein [Hyaloscypha bicolor E]|uniref:P-loop containing nucleoside triphosphate hydrolase protein n=1 Tax=Hyaloscypha bicolor E TaxID=1095630 RepID=A0A2J6TKZ2_9HELO|nr:P-loop containing nucleoside triphosphate hydrolase protein [Hyaloscypha bicolor E]PMD63677.1 P-loop containing nucleoside triphosphate hydrolase protein [Hyaloscypha bicolor E]
MADQKSQAALFQVYLRLRPPPTNQQIATERFLSVEEPANDDELPTHITLNPPNDNRRRAVEKFAFTTVFEEEATQLNLFHGTGVLPLVEGVLGPQGGDGRDGLLATLGVTGSGKSHTILGSRTQRGLTQLALDVLFRSISNQMLDPNTTTSLHATVAASDPSEAQVMSAQMFLDTMYGDPSAASRASSRAPTPMVGESYPPPTPRKNFLQRPSQLPQVPDISNVLVDVDPNAEYAILISMYEVYNDRIFDLLTPASPNKSTKEFRRRPLLFKPTEQSPDRKVVAGLRKIICGTMKEALMVLEAGLHERRVAGTGSNSVSSRSHGFFCVEVKKRRRSRMPGQWGGSALTIVDLAGSERARDAKTQGATLQEAGKINESLMYLGQCLQMQSDLGSTTKPNLVPFRQCKLTELLFSNSFPPTSQQSVPSTPSHSYHSHHPHPSSHRTQPQKAIMIVTADPLGDFNATSQILRYSALAREITVPRIPSVTSTILAQSTASHYFSPRAGGRMSPSETERETMEIAALEIARMSEEIDGLRHELSKSESARMELEAHLESFQDRAVEIEAEVREECYMEMEKKMQSELQRWKIVWESERERGEAHLDKKMEIYTRSIDAVDEESENKENEFDLEAENDRLRREVEMLRRDIQSRSPSKRMPLRESRAYSGRDSRVCGESERGMESVGREMERLRMSGESVLKGGQPIMSSPTKKVRKLTARKWDLMDEREIL